MTMERQISREVKDDDMKRRMTRRGGLYQNDKSNNRRITLKGFDAKRGMTRSSIT